MIPLTQECYLRLLEASSRAFPWRENATQVNVAKAIINYIPWLTIFMGPMNHQTMEGFFSIALPTPISMPKKNDHQPTAAWRRSRLKPMDFISFNSSKAWAPGRGAKPTVDHGVFFVWLGRPFFTTEKTMIKELLSHHVISCHHYYPIINHYQPVSTNQYYITSMKYH